MEEALHQCMESLEDQYALGGWFYENGLSYRLGENAIEATAAQLNAALDRAISEARDEYGPLGLEELERQLPEAAQAIALFAQMYGEDAPAHR